MSICNPVVRLCLLVCACLALSAGAGADERILDYHANLLIQTDGSLTVTETIRVRAEGNKIRRGIYRDFPTHYRDRLGNHYRVGFELLEVQRDSKAEAFHSENRSNGIRIYMGSADHLLAQGEHEYRLRYHTTRQLGFFEAYDELYWNVTGNGWIFWIDHASARIVLPGAVRTDDLRIAFYTGSEGSVANNADYRVTNEGAIEFHTTV